MLKVIQKTLPFELDYFPEELKIRAKNELFEDEETRAHSLRLLRSMLNEETNLRYQNDDLFLLAFLRTRKFDVKRAFNLVKHFYAVRNRRKDLYDNIDFVRMKKAIDTNVIGILPYRDAEGCVIYYIRPGYAWDPSQAPTDVVMQILTFGLLHAIRMPATQVAGIKAILDFKGFALSHIPHITPSSLWLMAEAVSNCFPARFRAFHFVNQDNRIGYAWAILKRLLTQKMRERVHFHGKNVKALHKYISPAVLPEELEGELGPFNNSTWGKYIAESADYFLYVASFGYNKTKKS